MLYCIFCSSLDVSETEDPHTGQFEYQCSECGEDWKDDESEFENQV